MSKSSIQINRINIDSEKIDDIINKGNNNSNSPFNEQCLICKSKLSTKKYICVICKDLIMCENCEEIHNHPVLKCKTPQISTLKDVFIYINKRNNVLHSLLKNEKETSVFGLFSDIFSGGYELKLSTNIKKITMRPNKSIQIPITLQNLSSSKVDCAALRLYLVAKKIYDLRVYTKELDLVINKREQNDVNILVESNNHVGEYDFSIELYPVKNIKLKSNVLEFKVIVNDDNVEEELNEQFKEYPSIILTSKETKEGIKKIMENEEIQDDPITILQFLKNNNNDVEKTINNLISLNGKRKDIL